MRKAWHLKQKWLQEAKNDPNALVKHRQFPSIKEGEKSNEDEKDKDTSDGLKLDPINMEYLTVGNAVSVKVEKIPEALLNKVEHT